MKNIFLMVAVMSTAFMQTGFAQQDHTAHSKTVQIPALLPLYYNVKDALVAGNATLSASKAGELVKALNGVDAKAVSGTNVSAPQSPYFFKGNLTLHLLFKKQSI
ncbi:hypothetical protein AAKU52_003512 [Pedobacter sp. CG_S7]|uniref:DUF3347 domain-containing protein n=1 Tax=Pedobacter sp. CG_S7 TaxID=3143930 RepID=UPI0033912C27